MTTVETNVSVVGSFPKLYFLWLLRWSLYWNYGFLCLNISVRLSWSGVCWLCRYWCQKLLKFNMDNFFQRMEIRFQRLVSLSNNSIDYFYNATDKKTPIWLPSMAVNSTTFKSLLFAYSLFNFFLFHVFYVVAPFKKIYLWCWILL